MEETDGVVEATGVLEIGRDGRGSGRRIGGEPPGFFIGGEKGGVARPQNVGAGAALSPLGLDAIDDRTRPGSEYPEPPARVIFLKALSERREKGFWNRGVEDR
jgi:hypothetical protein